MILGELQAILTDTSMHSERLFHALNIVWKRNSQLIQS
jgi:hypothetical protein